MAPLIVTGYVPLKDHPRSEAEYRALGARLKGVARTVICEDALEDCWMWEPAKRYAVRHAEGDNPAKNTLQYHVVQHQKIAWLAEALIHDGDPLIWIDYGVFHLPGITAEIIAAFIERVAHARIDKITLPGCWSPNVGNSSWSFPCWRFCGTVAIVPRDLVRAFDIGVQLLAMDLLMRERFVTWEVNIWERFERMRPDLFAWYEADHDATLFANFRSEG